MSDPTANAMPAGTAPASLIAAPSRNAAGEVDEPNAAYVGDAKAIADAVFVQLVNQAANRGETIDEAALRKQAEDEVAALHVDSRPASAVTLGEAAGSPYENPVTLPTGAAAPVTSELSGQAQAETPVEA